MSWIRNWSSRLNLTSFYIGVFDPCRLLRSWFCPCRSSICWFGRLWRSGVVDAFHFGYSFNNTVLMTTCAHNIVLLRIGYGTIRCLQCGWDWFILSCRHNKTLSTRESLWVQNLEGSSHFYSFCKHDMQWQVETWVVVCKPNGMDDIICLWQ